MEDKKQNFHYKEIKIIIMNRYMYLGKDFKIILKGDTANFTNIQCDAMGWEQLEN